MKKTEGTSDNSDKNIKPATRAGRNWGGNSIQVVTRVVTGNLNLRSDGSEMPGSRLPHGLFDRKDPSNFLTESDEASHPHRSPDHSCHAIQNPG